MDVTDLERNRRGTTEMQKIILIVVVIVLGLLAFNYFTTGELSLMPSSSSSGEGSELNRLQGEFRAAAREFRQAGRTAGLSGMDTTDAAGAALAAVDRIEKQVEKLAKETEDPKVRADAEKLLGEMRDFKRDIS
jgi:hypothetical protein